MIRNGLDVAQWIAHQPANQEVACLIPNQGTYNQSHTDVSLLLFLLPFPCL